MRKYFICRLMAAMTVLLAMLATHLPGAQAAVLNFYTRLDTANNFTDFDMGLTHCGSFWFPSSSDPAACYFEVYPGYLTSGIKQVTIKPRSCFPSGKHSFKLVAVGPGFEEQLVSYINLTRSGGTWSIPTFYFTVGEQTSEVQLIFERAFTLKKLRDCIEYIEFKKFL